jgi:hypothetical protein
MFYPWILIGLVRGGRAPTKWDNYGSILHSQSGANLRSTEGRRLHVSEGIAHEAVGLMHSRV